MSRMTPIATARGGHPTPPSSMTLSKHPLDGADDWEVTLYPDLAEVHVRSQSKSVDFRFGLTPTEIKCVHELGILTGFGCTSRAEEINERLEADETFSRISQILDRPHPLRTLGVIRLTPNRRWFMAARFREIRGLERDPS